jgi:hypothetical protein
MSKCLGVIWKYDHVLKWNAKFSKKFVFWKFIFIQKILTQNIWNIGAILNMKQITKTFIQKKKFRKKVFFDKRTSKGQ